MKVIEFVPEGKKNCSVKGWIHDYHGSCEIEQRDYPAIVICPGGAYSIVSDREAEPVAVPFFAAGYNTFILNYSVGEQAKGLEPLCQLAAVISQIRKNAKSWHTLPNQIAVCGFSAGGHLAASLGVLFNKPEFLGVFGKNENVRPDAMILCYPVITSDEFAHVGSIENVSGEKESDPGYEWFGLDKHVDSETPPAFLWHTAEDNCVPVENSLKMAMSLSKENVPFELHVFPEGTHGMSVCTEDVGTPSAYNARWMDWCIRWLEKMFE